MTGTYGDAGLTYGDVVGRYDGLTISISSGVAYSIEVDFTTPLLGIPASWTDITEWVRSFSTRRGRNHELGKMQAGEASLTLDNRDRRFDPTNTAGPYYPNIVPMRHVRIRVTTDLATYDLFRGFVEDWGQQWSGPAASGQGDARCEVHLVDGFSVLNRIDLTSYPEEVLQDEPLGYWPLGEPSGSVAATLGSEPTLTGTYTSSATLGVSGPLAGGGTAIDIDDNIAALGAMSVGAYATMPRVPPYSFECWVNPDVVTTGFLASTTDLTSGGFELGFAGTNAYMRLYENDGSVALGDVFSGDTTVWTTGAWQHFAVTVSADGAFTLYRNGVQAYTTLGPRPGKRWGNFQLGYAFDGRMAHAAFYPSVLSAQRVAAHYAANMGTITNQTVDGAINAVLDAIGWSGASISASSHTVQSHTPASNALSELLMLAEDTDGGLLFLQADGTLRFRSADDLRADVTTSAAWGDSSAELKYSDLVLRYDDEDLYTEVRATADGLVDAVASDSAAAVTYGPRTLETSGGVLADQQQLEDRATGYLTRYKTPAVRPESLTAVDSTSQPTRQEEMFASEIGRRVTVTRRPPGGGSAIVITSMEEGVSHSLSASAQMRTTLNLVPVLDATPWILADTTYGVLDSTTDLGW